jgi:alkaline phosphatase
VTKGRPDLTHVDTAAPDYMQGVAVPLGSETHGGEDVVVWAGGPSAALFHGTREQNYVHHAMAAALALDQ